MSASLEPGRGTSRHSGRGSLVCLRAKGPKRTRNSLPKQIKRNNRLDTNAVAADPSEAVSMRQTEALRINQQINEKLWQERLGGPTERTSVSRKDALESCAWNPASTHKEKEKLWTTLVEEAREVASEEPVLASFFHMTVIMHSSLEKSMAFLLANKLASPTLLGTQLTRLILDAYNDEPELLEACVADLNAVFDRDPACERYLQCLLFFKGFQATQVHRIAHWMWKKGRRALALALQSRMSEVFDVDIHPGATLGKGLMMDHASGIVIGETAIVGDNVSLLHHVTLGGSGTGTGSRHPIVGNGVLLGAGVSVLGSVVVGHCTKVGAGSVVVTDVPPHCVAVGVPAKVVKQLQDDDIPTRDMDQIGDFYFDYVI